MSPAAIVHAQMLLVDTLGWGFVALAIGLVMIVIDLHTDPHCDADTFIRLLVIVCVSSGILVVTVAEIPHMALFDEPASPSILRQSQSVVWHGTPGMPGAPAA